MTVTVKIIRNERQRPADKLADAELHFNGEPLNGLKLIGFAIWRRRDDARWRSRSTSGHPTALR